MDKKQSKLIMPKSISRYSDIIVSFLVGLIVGAIAVIAVHNIASTTQSQLDDSQPAKTSPAVVFDRIRSEGELVCATQTYNINEKVTQDPKPLFGPFTVPFSEASFQYRYVGEIKAGINLENAEFSHGENVITAKLQQPYIIANTPDMELSGLIDKDDSGIFAQVLPESVEEFEKECVKASEQQALGRGLIEAARDGAEKAINDMFRAALGDTYELVFEWE